jgi:hypothetical protein
MNHDPQSTKVYLATPLSENRSSFKFRGVERTYNPDNYTVDANGIASCWPFDWQFTIVGEEIHGYNDNCGSAYVITEQNDPEG